jgi:predicted metal-binding membrane protein
MALAARLPQRDALAIGAALAGITILAWAYLLDMARDMSSPNGLCMAAMQMPRWTAGYFWMMCWMWAVMMVGMMVPSAAPMILIYAAVARQAQRHGTPIAPTGAFTAGYLAMWTVFSLLATVAQWQLDRAALLSPMLVASSPRVGAGLLVAAGAYQWLPVKNSCLTHCRSPFHFLSGRWRPGMVGAFRMGIEHGAFCIGCCWALMLLLFFGGVMNLAWIGAITLFVLLEKVLPLGDWGGKVTGLAMVLLGAVMLASPPHP